MQQLKARWLLVSIGAALALVACGGGPVSTPDAGADSAAPPDGDTQIDAAQSTDAAAPVDAGETIDAAEAPDAFVGVDASEPEIDAATAPVDAGPAPGCDSNDDCGGGQFCLFPTGACGGAGSCQDAPFICGGIYLPVCGCDNNTYDNECNARAAGVSIKSEGDCPP